MKQMRKHLITLFTIVAICPLFAGEELYTIKLERPVSVGHTYTIRTVLSETFTMVIKQRTDNSVIVNQTRIRKLKLEADVEISEVSKTGDAVAKKYVVKSFTDMEAKGSLEILPAGTVVQARLVNGEKSFFIDNKAVSKELYKKLKGVISLDSNDKNDDDYFGTKKKVSIGEKWDIETAKVAEELSSDSLQIDKKTGQGEMRIKEKVKKNGIECLKIIGTMSIRVLSFPILQATETIDSTVSLKFDALYPVDVTKQCLDTSMYMNLKVNATGKLNDKHPDVSVEIIALSNETTEHLE